MLTDFDRRLKCILMTSASPSEGKSTVVSNLGIAVAEVNQKVLLIDADLRKPRLHDVFNLKNDRGLSDPLDGGGRRDDVPSQVDGSERDASANARVRRTLP